MKIQTFALILQINTVIAQVSSIIHHWYVQLPLGWLPFNKGETQ